MARVSRRAGSARRVWLVAGGLAAGLLAAEAGLRAAGAATLAVRSLSARLAASRGDGYRVLCLGESTTAPYRSIAYPAQLEEILNRRAPEKKARVINAGVPGTNTRLILQELPRRLERYRPRVVVAMMGVNDPLDVAGEKAPGAWRLGRLLRTAEPYAERARLALKRRLHRRLTAAAQADRRRRAEALLRLGRFHQPRRPATAAGLFRSALDADPTYPEACLEAARLWSEERNRDMAVVLLEAGLAADPGHTPSLNALGLLYVAWQERDRAEVLFRRSLAIDRAGQEARLGLSRLFRAQLKYAESEAVLRELLQIAPRNLEALKRLCSLLEFGGRLDEALPPAEAIVRLAPRDAEGYVRLARLHERRRRARPAETAFRAGLAKAAPDAKLYAELAGFLLRRGRAAQARDLLERGLALFPESVPLHSGLAEVHAKAGDIPAAEAAERRAGEISAASMLPATRRNYEALRAELRRRGIPLIAVQYPMRDAAPLRGLFRADEGVEVADNRNAFVEALARHGWNGLFVDTFAGDFGHCTTLGNRLLAENVADALSRLERRTGAGPA